MDAVTVFENVQQTAAQFAVERRQRQQALFDWWERIFDYVQMRKETRHVREHPLWLLFDEAAEKQPDVAENASSVSRQIVVDSVTRSGSSARLLQDGRASAAPA